MVERKICYMKKKIEKESNENTCTIAQKKKKRVESVTTTRKKEEKKGIGKEKWR